MLGAVLNLEFVSAETIGVSEIKMSFVLDSSFYQVDVQPITVERGMWQTV